MHVIRIFPLLILSLHFSHAELNTTIPSEPAYIDEVHTTVSKKILEWTDAFDTQICLWMGNDEGNVTTESKRKKSVRPPNKRVKSVDSFFQNKRYQDETEETFVTLRLNSEFSSRESNDFRVKLGGQALLSKSKKMFKFFIENVTADNVGNIEEDKSSSPEFGFHYFARERYGVESKYSLGLRGLDPFVRARYYMTFETDSWYIDPSQTFKYSVDDKFEEETNIYFDRHLEDLSLFRFIIHRKTEEQKKGMDYAFTFQYYWSPIENIGLRVSQSFIGNTKYRYIADATIEPPKTKNYGGIYDYTSSFSLRHNIWRKWFFYEVRPGVSFHKIHDYKPNYTLRVFLDFHFGKFR